MRHESTTDAACCGIRSQVEHSGRRKNRSEKSWIQYRYVLIVLGFIGLMCVYAMRVNLSVAMVAMVNQSAVEINSPSISCPAEGSANSTNESHNIQDGPSNWDRYTQGLVLGAFYYGYIITPIPGGRMAERYGGKWLVGLGTLITALLGLLIPYVAHNWGAMGVAVLRLVQGLGEGVTYPAMEALMSHWLPIGIRTIGVSLVHAGGYLGVVVGMSMSGFLADSGIMGGWPYIFYFFSLLTMAWFVLWALFVSNRPGGHSWASQEEVDFIENDHGKQKPSHVSQNQTLQITAVFAVFQCL